jgi:hypothetical protein
MKGKTPLVGQPQKIQRHRRSLGRLFVLVLHVAGLRERKKITTHLK